MESEEEDVRESIEPIAGDTYYEKHTTKFDDKQERKLLAVNDKATRLAERLKSPEYPISVYERLVSYIREEIHKEWPVLFGGTVERVFVLVDLDCFYAAVETLLHPEYKDVPLAVGTKLMLATCNYKARKFGIRSGMPGYKGLSLCPRLVIVKPDLNLYNIYSTKVMDILRAVDDEMEIYGIDEACLILDHDKLERGRTVLLELIEEEERFDCDEVEKLSAELRDIGGNLVEKTERMIGVLRRLVHIRTGLTISAGISVCRGLAKLASNMRKPNGQYTISDHFDDYIIDLNVDEINGVGKMTKETLRKALGIMTIRDLRKSFLQCAIVFNRRTLFWLIRHSYGLIIHDSSPFPKYRSERISHSISRTIISPGYKDILDCLWCFSEKLSEYLRGRNKQCTLLTVKIKFKTFDSHTKQKKFDMPFSSPSDIFNHAIEIIDLHFKRDESKRWIFHDSIRMIGLAISNFVKERLHRGLNFKTASELRFWTSGTAREEYMRKTARAAAEKERTRKKAENNLLEFLRKREEHE